MATKITENIELKPIKDLDRPLRVGIVGPESTGKSSLAFSLSNYYRSVQIAEYARTYVGNLEHAYTYADIEAIARWQIDCENTLLSEPPGVDFVFFDTELIITKVWFLHVYGQCPAFIEDHLRAHPMDFYLLCSPDLPWEPDPLRENPSIRDYLFAWYEKEIVTLQAPYAVIYGIGEERIRNACSQMEAFVKKKKSL